MLASALVATGLVLLAGCGLGADDPGPTSQGQGQDRSSAGAIAAPAIDSCTFSPPAPGVTAAGTVTLSGTNATGEQPDLVRVSYELLGADNQSVLVSSATVTSWRPGEVIAFETSPFAKAKIAPIGCRVAEVTVSRTDHSADLPAEGATCAVGAPTGTLKQQKIAVDLSRVDGVPASTELFVETALIRGGARVGEEPLTVPRGDPKFETMLLPAQPDMTCAVLAVRTI
jgi:hypothetical protein